MPENSNQTSSTSFFSSERGRDSAIGTPVSAKLKQESNPPIRPQKRDFQSQTELPWDGDDQPESWTKVERKKREMIKLRIKKFNRMLENAGHVLDRLTINDDINLWPGQREKPVAARRNIKEKKKRNRKIAERVKERTKPHSQDEGESQIEPEKPEEEKLEELLNSLQSTDLIFQDPSFADWLHYFENVVILGYQLSKANDIADVLVAVIAYFKMHQCKSILKTVSEFLACYHETFKKSDQDEKVKPHGEEKPKKFLEGWSGKRVLDGWELFKNHHMYKKVSFLITAAMSMSVCSIKKIEWNPLGLRLISLEAAKEQLGAVDVMDATIKTFVWVASTGYRCIQERSLRPILYADQRMQEFNTDCDYLLANGDQAVAGNVDDLNEFERKLENCLRTTCEMKALKTDGPTAIWLQSRYSQLVQLQFQIRAKHRNTQLRFAPIGWGLTGSTGVGKSTLSLLTMRTSLNAMGFDSDEKGCMTKDMFDKYDSTYTSDIMGVYMDDLGNGKAEFCETSPTDVIIKFFNNVSAQAVKAELNAKGVVFIAFKCGVITSNLEDYGVRYFSNCPESALRRFYHTRVSVMDEYRMPGSLCLDTAHPELQQSQLTKNVWKLTMQECVPIETANPGVHSKVGAYRWKIMTVNIDGKQMVCKDLSLYQYLDVVIALSKRHKMSQINVLERARQFNTLGFCKECLRPETICKCEASCKPQTMDVEILEEVSHKPPSVIVDTNDESLFSDPTPMPEEVVEGRKKEILTIMKQQLVGACARHISKKMLEMSDEEIRVYCGKKFQEELYQEWLQEEPSYWTNFRNLEEKYGDDHDVMEKELKILESYYRHWFNTGHHEKPPDRCIAIRPHSKNIPEEFDQYYEKRRNEVLAIMQHYLHGFTDEWITDDMLFKDDRELIEMCDEEFQEYIFQMWKIEYLKQALNTPGCPTLVDDVLKKIFFTCKFDEIRPHSDDLPILQRVISDAVFTGAKKWVLSCYQPLNWLDSLCGFRPIRSMTTRALQREVQTMLDDHFTPAVMQITPNWIAETRFATRLRERWRKIAAVRDFTRHFKYSLWGLGLLSLRGSYRYYRGNTPLWESLIVIPGTIATLVLGHGYYQERQRVYLEEYQSRRDALPASVKEVRDSPIIQGACAIAVLLCGLKAMQMWNNARIQKIKPQTMNSDGSGGWFQMFTASKLIFKKNTRNVGAISKHAVETFKKNSLFMADFERDDGTRTKCNVFFPRKGVVMFPRHNWHYKSDMNGPRTKILKVTVTRSLNAAGGFFSFILDSSVVYDDPVADCCYGFVPNCPDFRDRSKWFPDSTCTGRTVCALLVKEGNEILSDRVEVDFKPMVGHCYKQFPGGSYESSLSVVGACMGLVISETANPHILGFHIGGIEREYHGVCQTITLGALNRAIDELSKKSGVLLPVSPKDLPVQYGRTIIETERIYPHCKAANLQPHEFIDVLGSTRLRTSQKSQVVTSELSRHIAEVCGVENIWGPPKFKPNWDAFNKTLCHMVDAPLMFEPCAIERARQDWLKPLLVLAKQTSMKPLTPTEAIIGVEGKKFLDPLPMSTGMGFPLYGKKRPHFEDVFENCKLVDRRPSNEVQTEYQRMIVCWLNGERAYPVCAATLKDEPTKVTSEKVRVFQAAPVALSMAIRKYFLPISRFICQNALLSECAVGLNCFSKDWEKMMDHAYKYDQKDVLGWDYSKYDVRMPAQVTLAAWMCLIDIAQAAGYPDGALKIMRAMIYDIIHPLIDYNGVLLMAFNMNTSGNNMTVIINSIVGSIYVRLGLFHAIPEAVSSREICAALTYGDDFTGSIKPEYKERFNFEVYQQFLASHGIKITLPDKSSDSAKFLNIEVVDFLKRKSKFIPEIGQKLGCLDEMSIFKSLHSNVKSRNVSNIEQMSSCIEMALHEWFGHGHDVYELRRSQLKEVCSSSRANLPLSILDISFDQRVEMWKKNYEHT